MCRTVGSPLLENQQSPCLASGLSLLPLTSLIELLQLSVSASLFETCGRNCASGRLPCTGCVRRDASEVQHIEISKVHHQLIPQSRPGRRTQICILRRLCSGRRSLLEPLQTPRSLCRATTCPSVLPSEPVRRSWR